MKCLTAGVPEGFADKKWSKSDLLEIPAADKNCSQEEIDTVNAPL